jgi:hypothetical protein
MENDIGRMPRKTSANNRADRIMSMVHYVVDLTLEPPSGQIKLSAHVGSH